MQAFPFTEAPERCCISLFFPSPFFYWCLTVLRRDLTAAESLCPIDCILHLLQPPPVDPTRVVGLS